MASSGAVKLLLCGDVMTGRGVDQIMPHPLDPGLHEGFVASALDYVRLAEAENGPIPRAVGFDYIWGDALAIWDTLSPDVRIINLETAVTRSELYLPKGINYRMSPDHVACLTAARIDACTLANNHVLDWGEAGLAETLAVLARGGIRTAGAGADLATAETPAVMEVASGARVLMIACATGDCGIPQSWAAAPGRAGVNRVDLTDATIDRIAHSFSAMRRPGDIAIVSIHWGPNFGYGVPEAHRRFAHMLIDRAGVSVVHGHSSHHPMAAEIYHDRLILYGCGDLLNDYEGIGGMEDFRGDLTAAYLPSIDSETGALTGVEITPFRVLRFQLKTPGVEDFAWLRARLEREYARFDVKMEEPTPGHWQLGWKQAEQASSARVDQNQALPPLVC